MTDRLRETRTTISTTPSPLEALERHLKAGKLIVIDGATGTELERRGAAMHDKAWCAMATLTAPELLRRVHEDYVNAWVVGWCFEIRRRRFRLLPLQ